MYARILLAKTLRKSCVERSGLVLEDNKWCLFYLTTIDGHFPPLLRRALGGRPSGLSFYDQRSSRKWQPIFVG